MPAGASSAATTAVAASSASIDGKKPSAVAGIDRDQPRRALFAIVRDLLAVGRDEHAEAQHDAAPARRPRTARVSASAALDRFGERVSIDRRASTRRPIRRRGRRRGTRSTPARNTVAPAASAASTRLRDPSRADARVLLPRARIGGARRAAGCASRGCTPRRARRPRRATRRGRRGSPRPASRPAIARARPSPASARRAVTSCPAATSARHRPATEHSRRSGNEDPHRDLLRTSVRIPGHSNPDNRLSEIARERIRAADSGPTGHNGAMTGPAPTPTPPYFAVIFTSRRNEQPDDGFAETDERMFALAQEQPGFLGYETASSDDLGITISYWENEDAIAAWKAVAEHRAAQEQGRARWFDAYEVRVAARRARLRVRRASRDHRSRPHRPADADQARRRPRAAPAAHQRRRRGRRVRCARASSTSSRGCRGPTRSRPARRSNASGCAACATRPRLGEEWQYGLFPTDERSRDRRVRAHGAQVAGDDRDRILGARRPHRPRLRDSGRAARSPTPRSRSTASPPCTSAATRRTCAARPSRAGSASPSQAPRRDRPRRPPSRVS